LKSCCVLHFHYDDEHDKTDGLRPHRWTCDSLKVIGINTDRSAAYDFLLYRKTAHICISRCSKMAKIKLFINYKREMYALAHLNLSTTSFKCLS